MLRTPVSYESVTVHCRVKYSISFRCKTQTQFTHIIKMKYIIALLVALSMSVASYADVVKEGNVYVQKTTTVKEKETGVYYQDKDGIRYIIYVSPKGSLYIKKISKKTGREYKYYLPKDIQETIKKELSI